MASTKRTVSDVETLIKEFGRATRHVQAIADELGSEKLLYFYARYKQNSMAYAGARLKSQENMDEVGEATEGPCKTPKPFFFDFQGKTKWEAWTAMASMSKLDAMKEYIDGVTDYDPEWGEKVTEGQGLGVGVSKMMSSSDEDDSSCDGEEKTMIDWCKEGNVEQVKSLLANDDRNELDVNRKDDDGLAPLHWACDRGYMDIVQLLLSHKADTEIKDDEGQTPLHYAASCDHVDIVRILIDHGANKVAKDVDGLTPADTTQNQETVNLLSH